MDPQEKLEAMFCPRLDSTLVAAIYHDMGDFAACIPVLSALAAAAEPDDDDDNDNDDVVKANIPPSGTPSASASQKAAAIKTNNSTSSKKTPPTKQAKNEKNILIWSEEVADSASGSSGPHPSGLYKQGMVVGTSDFQRSTTSRNRSVVESTVGSSKPKPLRAVRNPNYKNDYAFEAPAEPEPIEVSEEDEYVPQQRQQQQQQLKGKKNRRQKGSAMAEPTDTLDDSTIEGFRESDMAEQNFSNHLRGLRISDNQSANNRTSGGSWQAQQEYEDQEEEDLHNIDLNGYKDDVVNGADEVEFLRNCFPDREYSDEYLAQILEESEGDLEATLDIILSQIFLESEQIETSSTGSGSMHSAGSQGTNSTTTSSLDDAFFQGVPKSKRKSRGGGGGADNGSSWKTHSKQNRSGSNDVLLNVIDGQDEFLIPENNDWATFDHQISILMNIFHTVPQTTIVSEFHANGTHLFRTVESLEKRLERENHYNSASGRERQSEFDTSLAQLIEIFPSHSAAGLKKMLVYNGGNVQDAMNAVLAADFARAEQKERPLPTPSQSKRRIMVPLQADIRFSDKNFVPTPTSHGSRLGSLPSTSNPTPGGTRSFSNTLLDNSNAELYNDDDDPVWCREQAQECREQRNELYRKAAQTYRESKGKGAGMGGIAAYYADEGKKLDAMVKQFNMRAARAVIQQHRRGNNDPNLVDLHGLTILEAQTVVKEAVTEWYARTTMQAARIAPKPLKIVCGIGSHSKDKIARLYPHILSLLMKDGWRCEAENGVILVKGAKLPTPASTSASTSSRTRRW